MSFELMAVARDAHREGRVALAFELRRHAPLPHPLMRLTNMEMRCTSTMARTGAHGHCVSQHGTHLRTALTSTAGSLCNMMWRSNTGSRRLTRSYSATPGRHYSRFTESIESNTRGLATSYGVHGPATGTARWSDPGPNWHHHIGDDFTRLINQGESNHGEE